MRTLTLQLSEDQSRFVTEQVDSGRYPDPSAVVRAAIVSLQQPPGGDGWTISALLSAIEEGDRSGVAEGDVFAEVRAARPHKPVQQ